MNNRDAQFELYRRFADAMLNTAYRITGNREDAEDALQDAFISAFKNLDNYREEATFGSWLKRIVINKALNLLKRKKAEMTFPEEGMPERSIEMNGINQSSFNPKVDMVLQAMQQLPTGYRTVLSLYLVEGYDHEEISKILSISKATSLTQYHRGKKRLKEIIKKTQTKITKDGQSGKVVHGT
ncbi:MAG: sigma-70 family RNA polymerase sigma factor [Bacteroidota bacterium]